MSFSRLRCAVNCVPLVLLLSGVLLLTTSPVTAGILDATWTAPTTNTDGSPLTDLASYRVYYGSSSSPCSGTAFFSVMSPTSSPTQSQSVSFRLTGLATGALYYVAVSAVDANGNASPCSPSASAVARGDFTVSPSGTVNFGSVNVGSSAEQSFTVSNTAGGTVSGSAAVSPPFTIVSGSPFTLAGVGATQAVRVRFTPTTNTAASATVRFTANGASVSRIVTGNGGLVGPIGPSIAITSPTSGPTYTTQSASLTLQGTASASVTQVTWTNSRGGSGVATGRTSWIASGIVLASGSNLLIVTARDAVGNTAAATLTATYNPSNGAPTTPPPPPPTPLTGLVAAYGFEEGAGPTVADASGNSNTGTLEGGVAWTSQGRFGDALVFDGATAVVTVPDAVSLEFTAQMTLEAWVYPTGSLTGWRAVLAKNTDRYYLMASSDTGNRPVAGGTWTAGNQNTYGPSTLPLNTWTHLAATYDGTQVRLYVNGVQVASQAQTTALTTSTGTLQIGGDAYPGENFTGLIDEVRVYNRALSQAEIQADMNTPIGP